MSAWGGSRLPRSCGARAARSRERRGKQQARREGAGGTAGGRDAGAAPSPPGLGAPGPTVWGPLGPRGQRRNPRPLIRQVTCPTPVPRVLGCYKRTGNPWRLSSEGPFPWCHSHLPPSAAEWVGQPSTLLSAPINPSCPASGLGPALSPSLQRSSAAPGCQDGGEGESFRAPQLPALSPSSGPRPAPLPVDHSPDRGCPALGTRSSSGSVASSSSALTRLFFPFGVPGPLFPGLLLQARCPMLRSRWLAALPSARRWDRPRPLRSSCVAAAPSPRPAARCAVLLPVPDVSPERLEGAPAAR